jgi:capsular polysaccharide biosynthesis protein
VSLEIADVYTRQHNADEQGKLREERVILSTLDRPNRAMQIWPLTRIIVPAAALLGLLAAAVVILCLTYFDTSIRSSADVQQHLGLPLLGRIPRHVSPATHVVSPTPQHAPVAAGRKDPSAAT